MFSRFFMFSLFLASMTIFGKLIVITRQKDKISPHEYVLEKSLPSWYSCADLCSRMKVCQAINFIARNKSCQILDISPCPGTLKDSFGDTFLDRSAIPDDLAGRCFGHNCKETEICVEHKTSYTCEPINKLEAKPQHCGELVAGSKSGVYTIYPFGNMENSSKVFCDMETGQGGWTVIQRRFDGCVDFFRNWTMYEEGFGSANGEYWLGNKVIHQLTYNGNHALRIDLEDFEGVRRYAQYSSFSIGDSSTQYTLSVSGYSGDAGDSFAQGHSGHRFYTFDKDTAVGCAQLYHGAWWYNQCHYSNLNGKYFSSEPSTYGGGIHWVAFHGYDYSLKATTMMILKV